MNNVYDEAHGLARAIKNSEEYKKYLDTKDLVYSNEKNKEMLVDFREKVMKLQMDQMSGKEVSEEEVKKIGKIEEVLMLNSNIKDFFMAEMRFSQMIQDVNNIIEDAIDIKEN